MKNINWKKIDNFFERQTNQMVDPLGLYLLHYMLYKRRNPNKGLFVLAVFGFRSFGPGLYRSVPNYFKQTKVSEIQTDCSDFRHKFTNLHICVWNPNILFCLSYMCLDFRHKFVSEIQTICSDFRHFCLFEVIWYQTEIQTCLDFRRLL